MRRTRGARLYPGSNCAAPRNRNSGRHASSSSPCGDAAARHATHDDWSKVLPKFFFQVIENGVEGPVDAVGLDYPNLDAAEQDAAAVIAGMIDSAEPQGTQTIEIVISDEGRQPLARVKAALSRDRMS